MIFTKTKLDGAFIIDLKRLEDDRGFFARAWCNKELEEHGLNASIVQTNISFNKKKGTLRGMHFQCAPFGECKTVRCTEGAIFDVIIDIRPLSHTYKQWIGVELTARSFRALYIPDGFAHGYLTLEDNTSVQYSVSQYYSPDAEAGLPYNDPCFNIHWPGRIVQVSERDRKHPFFEQMNVSTLTYAQP